MVADGVPEFRAVLGDATRCWGSVPRRFREQAPGSGPAVLQHLLWLASFARGRLCGSG